MADSSFPLFSITEPGEAYGLDCGSLSRCDSKCKYKLFAPKYKKNVAQKIINAARKPIMLRLFIAFMARPYVEIYHEALLASAFGKHVLIAVHALDACGPHMFAPGPLQVLSVLQWLCASPLQLLLPVSMQWLGDDKPQLFFASPLH